MASARPISHWFDVHVTDTFRNPLLRRPSYRNLVIVFLATASAYVVFRNAMQVERGGHIWTMSDWLINYDAGFVRRGLTGWLTFFFSDLYGTAPAVVAGLMQTLIYGVMTLVILYMLSRIRMTGPVLMLAVSPVFLLMPFYFVKLAMCKEMIGFLGLALIALTAFNRSKATFWSGIAVFCLSGLAHEINGFLAPAVLASVVLLAANGVITRREAQAAAGISAVMASVAILSAMVFTGAGLSAEICQAIVSRGGNPHFCGADGAIGWLERDAAYGMSFTWEANIASGYWPWFLGGYVLSMIPFCLFRVAGADRGRLTHSLLVAAVLGIVVFAPLFIVASDWGRWISMHMFALTMLTLMALRLGLVVARAERIRPVYLLYGLVWAMPDYGATLTLGLLAKLWRLSQPMVATMIGGT